LKRVLNEYVDWDFLAPTSGGCMWAQINLQVPQRAGNFLANLSTISFSRLTEIHEVSLPFNIETLNVVIFSLCPMLQPPCERQYKMFMHGAL
jgi:hypothetical protein